MKKIVIASTNSGKIKEFKSYLEPLGFEVLDTSAFTKKDIEETGKSFEENAIIKAKAIYDICNLPVIADDSGICVDALGGRPGIYSARYGATAEECNNKLLLELQNVKKEDRKAYFECAIALVGFSSEIKVFSSRVYGYILEEPVGTQGFGYDPIFVTDTGVYFGNISIEEKSKISHRGKALKKLVEFLSQLKK